MNTDEEVYFSAEVEKTNSKSARGLAHSKMLAREPGTFCGGCVRSGISIKLK